jgi:transposase
VLPERAQVEGLIAAGTAAGTATARKLMHARILLKADRGAGGPGWVDQAIAEVVAVSQRTVSRVRKQYGEQGVEPALTRRAPRREYRRKLDGEQETQLIALACSTPPDGQGRRSLRLLADRMVELAHSETLSYQTVRRVLKKRTQAVAA